MKKTWIVIGVIVLIVGFIGINIWKNTTTTSVKVETETLKEEVMQETVMRSEERRVGKEERNTRWPRDWSSDVCSSDLYDYIYNDIFWAFSNGRCLINEKNMDCNRSYSFNCRIYRNKYMEKYDDNICKSRN